MPKEHIGRSITLEPDKVYVVVSEGAEETINFSVVDTLTSDEDDSKFLACIVRGMIANALQHTEQTLDAGIAAFSKDQEKSGEKLEGSENTVANSTLDGFPKTVGNA